MVISILVANEHVESVKAKVKDFLPSLQNHNNLRIPVSATGQEPATHWFCSFRVPGKLAKELMDAQEYSIIEALSPGEFLPKHGLQKIVIKK
jgi:hypothetical protein